MENREGEGEEEAATGEGDNSQTETAGGADVDVQPEARSHFPGGVIGGSIGAGLGSILFSSWANDPIMACIGGALGGFIGAAFGGFHTGAEEPALLGAFGAALGGAAGAYWGADTDSSLGHWAEEGAKCYAGIFLASALTAGTGALCSDTPLHLLNVTSSSVVLLLHVEKRRQEGGEGLSVDQVVTSFLVHGSGSSTTPADVLLN